MSYLSPRKNFLLVLSVLVYLVTLVLLLSELDRQYYQVRKEAIIKYHFRELFPHDTRQLQEVSRRVLILHGAGKPVPEALDSEWRALARAMLRGEGCVFRIRIVPRDEDQLLVEDDREKFVRLNNFSNTLFYRDFQNVVSYEIAGGTATPWIGLLSFHYTTPENYAPVRALTKRYRKLALLLGACVTLLFVVVARTLILPMKRVVSRIDSVSASAAPKIMARPASLLERAYNSLARDAILLRVAESIRNATTEQPLQDRPALMQRICRLLVDLLDCRAVFVFDLLVEGGGESISVSSESHASSGDVRLDRRREWCRERVLTKESLDQLREASRMRFEGGVACDLTLPGEPPSSRTVLVMFPAVETWRSDPVGMEWHLETFDRLAEQLRQSLLHLSLQQRYIRSERSRANINLARNLGHDLTNIIATSRWDLRTIQKIVEGMQPDAGEGGIQQQLLRDSVDGLVNSTRLLQEIVNIYRSFGYIRRPRYEEATISHILDEILEVFSLSLPPGTEVRRDYEAGVPPAVVEPRLLKLAVFNVLTNAIAAIKQNAANERPNGRIDVLTGYDSERDQVRIVIRDNGTGIRDADGQLASQSHIETIFRYGVSTKSEDGGEGLGLSWAWTIVEEFHDGRIDARNLPDGGAEFTLLIARFSKGSADAGASAEETDLTKKEVEERS